MTTFGDALKAAREAAGLKQSELGFKVGTDGSQVSRWENGDMPRHETVMKLDEALGFPPGHLYLLAGMVSPDAVGELLEDLPKKVRDEVVAKLRAFQASRANKK